MLDCVTRELENRVFPRVFTHREPIRSRHLGSCDLGVDFQSSDARASKMAGMPTQFEVLPPLEEWHINLEVGNQVYQLLKGFRKRPHGLTLCPHCTWEGFRTGFEKTLPQVVIAPYFLRGFSSPKASNFSLEDYEHNNPSLHVLDFT